MPNISSKSKNSKKSQNRNSGRRAVVRRPPRGMNQATRSTIAAPGMHSVAAPAVVSSVFTPYFNQSVRDGITVVRGRDLVITELICYQYASAIGRVPMNPALWLGTRLAVVAGTFMSHRPKRVIIHYQPASGTSVSGNIYFGTFTADTGFYGGAIARAQSLISSGGGSTPIWSPISADVSLVGLQQPWYDTEGIESDSIPLVTYFSSANAPLNQTAGSVWVEYEWEFSRPYVGRTTLTGTGCFYDLIPRLFSTTVDSTDFTFAGDTSRYPVGSQLMVTPSTNISIPLKDAGGFSVVGDLINTGLDWVGMISTLGSQHVALLDDAGTGVKAGATSANAWMFLARAIAASLL